MTANELRIGNWVLSGGKPIQVTIKTFANEWGETLFQLLNPIPLTPEILEKAGFEFDGACWDFEGFKIWQHEKCFYQINEAHLVYVDYLHQLQNLYFALTGEELEINLL